MNQPGGPQPAEAWGFEVRRCRICGEVKGGSPFRFCKCMRDDKGLGDQQPHGNRPNIMKGDWVAQAGMKQPHFGRVRDVYEIDGEWFMDISLWTPEGSNPGRLSPPLDGPKHFEPACPADHYRRIAKPTLPMDRFRRGLYGQYDHLLKFV